MHVHFAAVPGHPSDLGTTRTYRRSKLLVAKERVSHQWLHRSHVVAVGGDGACYDSFPLQHNMFSTNRCRGLNAIA